MISKSSFSSAVVNIFGVLATLGALLAMSIAWNDWTIFIILGVVTAVFGAMFVLVAIGAYVVTGVEWLAEKFYDKFITKENDK